jgi:Protein of unknown function (DUF3306)
MSEGFLSRWSRLKKKTSDGPLVSEGGVDIPARSPGDSSSMIQGVKDHVPAKLMPWAGVNPAYQGRPYGMGPRDVAPDQLAGQTQVTEYTAVDGQGASGEANIAAEDASAKTSSAKLNAESLPDIGSLNLDSDFKPFMQANVPAESRNAALKKLFSDPSFNVMDGLDTYVADYSLPDPIPAEMLKEMLKAKAFCLFDDVVEDEEQGLVESAGGPSITQAASKVDSTPGTGLAVGEGPGIKELATQELTTQELTTQELATQELTTQELAEQELTVEEHLRLIPGPRVAQAPEIEYEKQKGELGR